MKKRNLFIGIGAGLAAGAIATIAVMKFRKTIPDGVEAIYPFNAGKYLGTWYEIARLDFKFEKGLSHVTANYSLNNDGSIKVINRGYKAKKGTWNSAEGKAVFVEDAQTAMLKVSFFGPFYSGYNVVEIDEDYKYALVFGRNLDYMWILSREKTIPKSVERKYLEIAEDAGYDISELVWTEQ